MDIKIPKRKPGGHGPKVEEKYRKEAIAFVDYMKQLQTEIELKFGDEFKISARGWGYIFEGKGLITKPQIDDVQWAITRLRKEGFLPLDFTARDEARAFHNREEPEFPTPDQRLTSWLKALKGCQEEYECISFWEYQPCYIQMIVEKIDLRTLFLPTIKKYHIPIANARGWEDISMRADMAKHFKQWEEKGKKLVLLYCGDLDLGGYMMTEETEKKNEQIKLLEALKLGTGWDPKNLKVDRFGLNRDFVESAGLTWIDNMLSSKGKEPDYDSPVVKRYIAYVGGKRKCEANALVVRPDLAEQLVEDAVQKYLGKNPFPAYDAAIEEGRDEVVMMMDNLGVQSSIDDWLAQLE